MPGSRPPACPVVPGRALAVSRPRVRLGGRCPWGQADVGEGAVAVEVGGETGHPAAAHVKEVRAAAPAAGRPDVEPARLPTTPRSKRHQYPLVIELVILPGLDAIVLPRFEELAPRVAHLGDAAPGRRPGVVDDRVLDLRVGPIDRPEVASFP